MVELTEKNLELLLSCRRRTKDRDFTDWQISTLINEAIYGFYEKYGKNVEIKR